MKEKAGEVCKRSRTTGSPADATGRANLLKSSWGSSLVLIPATARPGCQSPPHYLGSIWPKSSDNKACPGPSLQRTRLVDTDKSIGESPAEAEDPGFLNSHHTKGLPRSFGGRRKSK